jgi:hypothetical protein
MAQEEAEIMLKRTIVALAVAAVATMTVASAQESATFTLKSGERISGQLVDMGGAGFQVRVNGQDRTIPIGEMALIDFSGSSMSQADWNQVNSGEHVIWLRNGETFRGQLYDVGGTSPLRITVKTGSGQRELQSSEVSRIGLGVPTNNTSTAATSGAGSNTITVPATQRWTPTGISVRRGETLTITAEGEIRISPDANDRATPDGIVNQRFDRSAPLPRTLAGALIGRIGNGQPFGIGKNMQVPAPAAGALFLGINEANVADNEGSFQVTVSRSGAPRR